MFDKVETADNIEIVLRNPIDDTDVIDKPILTFTVVATYKGKSGRTAVVVQVPVKVSAVEIPQFSKVMFIGELKLNLDLNVEPISIVAPTSDMSFEILEGNKHYTLFN